MVYGQEAILPIELEVQSLRIAIDTRLEDQDSLLHHLEELKKLDKTRANVLMIMETIQKWRKTYYDSKLRPKAFMPNDLVLLYDNWFKKISKKFQVRWYGPYRVIDGFLDGSVQLEDFMGIKFITQINGNWL